MDDDLSFPDLAAPCADCREEVLYHSPPLREGETVRCVPCGLKLMPCPCGHGRALHNREVPLFVQEKDGTTTKSVQTGLCSGRGCQCLAFKEPTAPPNVSYLRQGVHAIDRLAKLFTDRYTHRYGGPPPAIAVDTWRAGMLRWDPANGDLDLIADDIGRFRDAHPIAWKRRFLLPPKDPVKAFNDIQRDVANAIVAKAQSAERRLGT